MTIAQINSLSKALATNIVTHFLTQNKIPISYNAQGNLQGNFASVFNHKGLYAFILEKSGIYGIVYVGKSESDKDDRLRQHLTGQNKKTPTPLKSTRHKNKNIKDAIADGFNVELALFPHPDFEKSSLACLEIDAIIIGKSHLSSANINWSRLLFQNIETWNKRIG